MTKFMKIIKLPEECLMLMNFDRNDNFLCHKSNLRSISLISVRHLKKCYRNGFIASQLMNHLYDLDNSSGMKTEELSAIYACLINLEPISN